MLKKIIPKLVIDVHEDLWRSSGYKYGRFLDPISKTWLIKNYISKIMKKMPPLVMYSAPGGTNPKYVTNPIARKGISTIVYETYKKNLFQKII